MSKQKTLVSGLCAVAMLGFMATGAMAQPTYSIDFQGPSIGLPDAFFGLPITEGDILSSPVGGPPIGVPAVPAPPPAGLVIPGGPPGPGSLGIIPAAPAGGFMELDALSYGRDPIPPLDRQLPPGAVFFSVDEFATGLPTPMPPNVFTEGAIGAMEASADVYTDIGLAALPIPPGVMVGNIMFLDGNGMPSPAAPFPGLGQIEPNAPTPGMLPDRGDNLDAVDVDTAVGDLGGPVFFSMDFTTVDPLEGLPTGTGTALINGFSGADVVVSFPGGAPAMYAPAALLGLDLVLGFNSDDLDALALLEVDGDLVFTPGVDLIWFSVRRGSAVIGAPDSIWGAPIEEGDILVPPVPGGASPFPGILIPGEALGLATLRVGGGQFGPDDLDALDVVPEPATLSLLALGALALLRRRRA